MIGFPKSYFLVVDYVVEVTEVSHLDILRSAGSISRQVSQLNVYWFKIISQYLCLLQAFDPDTFMGGLTWYQWGSNGYESSYVRNDIFTITQFSRIFGHLLLKVISEYWKWGQFKTWVHCIRTQEHSAQMFKSMRWAQVLTFTCIIRVNNAKLTLQLNLFACFSWISILISLSANNARFLVTRAKCKWTEHNLDWR